MLPESNSNPHHPPLTLEITVISAQGLKNPSTQSSAPSFFFSRRPIKPFATLGSTSTCKPPQDAVHRTKTDDRGAENPTWNETFQISVQDSSFSSGVISSSDLLLQVNAEKRRVGAGRTLLGWCYVPMADIVQPPTGPVRFLSYRLRARDGSRSRGIVNLAARLQGLSDPDARQTRYPNIADGRPCPAIGIPVRIKSPGGSSCDGAGEIRPTDAIHMHFRYR